MWMPIQSFVLLLPLVGLWSLVPGLTPTSKMFGVAFSMLIFIKLHCLMIYRSKSARRPTQVEILYWFIGWAGLDPRAFFEPVTKEEGQGSGELKTHTHASLRRGSVEAMVKIAIGIVLLSVIAPMLLPYSKLVAGWVGMAGIVFLLHCGLIHLSAVFWKGQGRNVEPIMNSPLLATSVSEFWGKRWNLAFRDYAHVCVFSPLIKTTSGQAAVLAGFLFSGIVHDLAISVPAGGGYGWPTLYFVLQAIGLLLERHLKKAGVFSDRRWVNRIWTAIWVAGPVFILFHQPFVLNVIVPIVEWFSGFVYV